jgi:hypothetical protein
VKEQAAIVSGYSHKISSGDHPVSGTESTPDTDKNNLNCREWEK